jgi:hypothetical protein
MEAGEQTMTRIRDVAFAWLAAGVLITGVSACQKEGPAERAGKAIDKTVEKAGQQIERTGQKIEDAATSVGK